MIITILRLSPKTDHTMFFDSSLGIWYIVFKTLLVGFICLWVGVVLYSAYKYKWKLPKRKDIAKLKKYLTWSNLLKLFTYHMIAWYLIRKLYKELFELLTEIFYLDTNILYIFMGFLAMKASFEYLKFIFDQLNKSDKKDFSLTCFMQTKITVNWFIKCVYIFCMGDIFIKYIIFKKYNILKLWFK